MKGSTAQLTLFVAGAFLTVTIVVLYSTQSHILGGTTRQFRIKSPSSLEKAVVPSASPWSESGGDAFRNTRDHWHMYTGLSADNHTTRAAAGSRLGFMMAMHYSDQMTAACVNFRNLLCFVGQYMKDVRVVEPFLAPIGSTLGICLSPTFDGIDPKRMNRVKLSDIYDVDAWKSYAETRTYAPIISWEEYMNIRPNKIILVHHQWYTKECEPYYMINATKEYVTENKFEIVKQVCINFRYTGLLSNQGLIDFIYGEFKPNEVVVVFNRWGGIVPVVEDFRFSLKSTLCYRGKEKHLLFHPSKQLASDIKEYSRRYMNGSSRYVAAMFRVGFFAIREKLKKLPDNVQRNKLLECFRSINQKLITVKNERNLSGSLLTLDVGKYGSIYFRRENSPFLNGRILNETVPKFFEIMFGQSLTQKIWEDSFESAAHFKFPGYVAIMQKHLAANSQCLILAGGGTFQESTRMFFNEIHPNSDCILTACGTVMP